MPDDLAPFHRASSAERDRRVRRVLRQAWRVYAEGELSLVQSVRRATENMAESEFALRKMRRVLFEINLVAWEEHPNRTRADVHALFRKAISRGAPHRGGWRVSR